MRSVTRGTENWILVFEFSDSEDPVPDLQPIKLTNKIEIKKAVEQLFKIKVERVRVQNKRGKMRRVGRSVGKKKDWKKAYVKLKEGEKMIEYFEAV